jgi:hypothetical protein
LPSVILNCFRQLASGISSLALIEGGWGIDHTMPTKADVAMQ